MFWLPQPEGLGRRTCLPGPRYQDQGLHRIGPRNVMKTVKDSQKGRISRTGMNQSELQGDKKRE